jgi:crossover junction endodeoxyribonuclease RuvC
VASPVRSSSRLVLGIDPGTAVTGFGVVRTDGPARLTLVECGVIRTSPSAPLPDRLREIHEGIAALLDRHAPHIMAVESVFYARNVRTTITLGHTRGVILLAAALRNVEICEYPPAEIKKAVVGTGQATKAQVQFMTARLLRLAHAPQPADAADGVACAITACIASQLGPRVAAR